MMKLSRRLFLAMPFAALAGGAKASVPLLPAANKRQDLARPKPIAGLLMADAAGKLVDLASYVGRTVVLNLWAPWCVPCRDEMPSLAALQSHLDAAKTAVLPLSFDHRGAAIVKAFYTEVGITNLPVLTGDAINLQATTQMVGLPTTLVFNAAGLHVSTVIGAARWDDDATVSWISALPAA